MTDRLPRSVRELFAGRAGRILVTVAAGWFLALGTRLTIPALLPFITSDFGITNATAGFAVTILWSTYALTQFPAGLLTDRVGERTLLVGGLCVGGVGIAVFANAAVFPMFVVAAVVFGFGTGLYGPPRVTILSQAHRGRNRAANGIVSAVGNLGASALPFVAVALALRYGWRMGVLSVLPLFVVVGIVLWRSIPGRAFGADVGAPDWRRTVDGLRSATTQRSALLAFCGVTLTTFVYQGFTTFYPTYLHVTKSVTEGEAGALFGVFFLTAACVQPVSGHLADRFGDRTVLVSAVGIASVTYLALPFVDGIAMLAVVTVLLGVQGSAVPVINAYIVDVLPDDLQGSGFGLLRTVYIVLGSTGSLLIGVLSDADLFDPAFQLLGLLAIASAVLYSRLPVAD